MSDTDGSTEGSSIVVDNMPLSIEALLRQDDTECNFRCMTDVPVDQMMQAIEALRERRLKAWKIYSETLELKRSIQRERDLTKLNKKLNTTANKLDTTLRAIEALEKLATDIRVIRMELGLDP